MARVFRGMTGIYGCAIQYRILHLSAVQCKCIQQPQAEVGAMPHEQGALGELQEVLKSLESPQPSPTIAALTASCTEDPSQSAKRLLDYSGAQNGPPNIDRARASADTSGQL